MPCWSRPRSRRRQSASFRSSARTRSISCFPLAAEIELARAGLPEPPPWRRPADYQAPEPGWLRITGFASKPELEKLNRNSIYCFVNRRLVRDRLLMHAVSEAYRNILPPTSFPVVLLFVEMPPEEVDVNVHPAKTEVRFRQASWLHDFVRDTIRNKLTLGRPAAGFLHALTAHPSSTAALVARSVLAQAWAHAETPTSDGWLSASWPADEEQANDGFTLAPPAVLAAPGVLPFAARRAPVDRLANGHRRPAPGCVSGGRSSRSRRKSAKRGQPLAAWPGIAAAAGTAARILHPGSEPGGSVDHRPARRP